MTPAVLPELLHKPCGQRTGPRVVCSHCGERIDARDTEPVVGKGNSRMPDSDRSGVPTTDTIDLKGGELRPRLT